MNDATDLIEKPPLAVRRKPHHLVLVAILGESEELRERRVEQAQRMRELDRAPDLNLVAAPDTPHDAAEVAEPVDRNDGGLIKWRCEEGAGQMGAVVFDEMDANAARLGQVFRGESLRQARHLKGVFRTGDDAAPVNGLRERTRGLAPEVGARVPRDRD